MSLSFSLSLARVQIMGTSVGGYLCPKFSVVYSVSELAALDGSVVACAYIAPIMGIMQTAFSLVQ